MTVTQVSISDINRRTGRTAWLSPFAALAYEHAKSLGMPGGCVSDAGRTTAEQWEMWNAYLAGHLVATAAYPGTSKHERGNALDLKEPARSWMHQNWELVGFIPNRVKREPWHFEHDGRVILPELTEHLTPTVKEILIMAGPMRIQREGSNAIYFVNMGTGAFVLIPNSEANSVLGESHGGPHVVVNARQFDVLKAFAASVRDSLR